MGPLLQAGSAVQRSCAALACFALHHAPPFKLICPCALPPAAPPPGQAVCSALLNHCYRLLADLMADQAAAEAEAAEAEQ